MLNKYKMFLEGFKSDIQDEILSKAIERSLAPKSSFDRSLAQGFKDGGATTAELMATRTALAARSPNVSLRGDRLKRDLNVGSSGLAVGAGLGLVGAALYKALRAKKVQKQNWEKYGCSNIKNEIEKKKCETFLKSRN